MNDIFCEVLWREKPMLETLLVKDKNISLKLLSKLRNIKKMINKLKR